HEVAVKKHLGPKDLLFLFFPPGPDGRRRGLDYIRNVSSTGQPNDAPVSETAWLAQIKAAIEWGARQHPSPAGVERIDCPTLVAHGQLDVMVSPEKGRLLAELIPGATFKLFPDAGHACLFEEVAEFTADLLQFLG